MVLTWLQKDFDCDANLIRLWALVKSIKDDCLFLCRNDGPAAYVQGNRIDAEGYVMSNEFHMSKLVDGWSFHTMISTAGGSLCQCLNWHTPC